MKAQTAVEYLSTYGWALLLLIIVLAVIFQLGLFDIGAYLQTSADVVGFNSFNINRFLLKSDGHLELGFSNMLEDRVTITQITVDGSAVTNPSPALPFNLSAGSNVTFACTSSLTGTPAALYNARVSIKFDVERGTADHSDSGFLRGEFQPG